jgi:hypothetical protein
VVADIDATAKRISHVGEDRWRHYVTTAGEHLPGWLQLMGV